MKKLNVLFDSESSSRLDNQSADSMNTKSEIARAAMVLGLGMLEAARESMTDREFYDYVKNPL